MRSGEVTTAVVSGIDIILVLCVAVCDQEEKVLHAGQVRQSLPGKGAVGYKRSKSTTTCVVDR